MDELAKLGSKVTEEDYHKLLELGYDNYKAKAETLEADLAARDEQLAAAVDVLDGLLDLYEALLRADGVYGPPDTVVIRASEIISSAPAPAVGRVLWSKQLEAEYDFVGHYEPKELGCMTLFWDKDQPCQAVLKVFGQHVASDIDINGKLVIVTVQEDVSDGRKT